MSALFDVFKKREVPGELPNLAVDEIHSELVGAGSENERDKILQNTLDKIQSNVSSEKEKVLQQIGKADSSEVLSSSIVNESEKKVVVEPIILSSSSEVNSINSVKSVSLANASESLEIDRGFFKEMISEIAETEDARELDKISNKYLQNDSISSMKEYWEKQKPDMIIKTVGKDLRMKILEKSDKLHKLEREWQDGYFALMTKEEQIREEEEQLKAILNEFIDVCKKATGKKKNIRGKGNVQEQV